MTRSCGKRRRTDSTGGTRLWIGCRTRLRQSAVAALVVIAVVCSACGGYKGLRG